VRSPYSRGSLLSPGPFHPERLAGEIGRNVVKYSVAGNGFSVGTLQSPSRQVGVNPMVILVAEDNDDVRLTISNILKADGFTVLTTYDGRTALELSRCYPGTIDLLLSDVDMPFMDGQQLCQNIVVERPGIKVLLMSGGVGAQERAGMNGIPFLQKPFTATALQHSIKTLLGPMPRLRAR
jgi:CheY-like chemotaxis protein